MTRVGLLVAAAVLALPGCSADQTGPDQPIVVVDPPQLAEITGTVVVDALFWQPGVHLKEPSGDLILLIGPEVQRLASLNGADVRARGLWEGDELTLPTIFIDRVRAGFVVSDFLVLAVFGRPAMDGVLGTQNGRYYLRLRNGELFWIHYPPSELTGHVGQRLWVTGSPDDSPLAFGII